MNNVKLLDCTLRDGGYSTNWTFGHNSIVNIYSRLVASGVDIIELGYLRDWDEFNMDRTSAPRVKDFDYIFDIEMKQKPMLLAMIDLGNCKIENICDANDTILDGIRLTFKKPRIDEAMAFGEQVIDKGFKLFLQSVSITDYNDSEYLGLIEKLNKLKPYSVSIVDTYGLMHDYDLMRYFHLLDHNLDINIGIGYHPHNNFQLAYANAIKVINSRAHHTLMVDTTVNGIGKDSGNACTELMAHYLNKNFNRSFEISHLLEIIESELAKLKESMAWGYSFIGFISASNGCRTEYTKYLLAKKTLSIKSINKILQRIDRDKKTTAFHEEHIEQLYQEYQQNDINDSDTVRAIEKVLEKQPLLLLAPGKSLNTQHIDINRYISEKKPIVIAVNHVPEQYEVDYVFISNGQRYGRIAHLLLKYHDRTKIIITSNITEEQSISDYVVNYCRVTEGATIKDNSMLMFLNLLSEMNISDVALAGFDGFSDIEADNYFDQYLVLDKDTHSKELNRAISEELKRYDGKLDLHFITKTRYRDAKLQSDPI